jgi:hypothetical protein
MTAPTPTAHTLSKNTFVGTPKVTGGIWYVPSTSVLPTDATSARPTNCVRLGGVSEDGYTYSTERQVESRMDWNGDKVRSLQKSKDDTFEVTFIEFLNSAVLQLTHGFANVTVTPATSTSGTKITTKSVATQLDRGAYIIDTFDGQVQRRRCIPAAQPVKIDPVTEKPGDWSVWKVTFDLYPDSQGVTSYTYTVLNDKIGAVTDEPGSELLADPVAAPAVASEPAPATKAK